MCQIVNSRNFSGIMRGCVTSSRRINQIVICAVLATLECFGMVSDPEEMIHLLAQPVT